MVKILLIAIALSFSGISIFAQTDSLKIQIHQLLHTKNADVGVSCYGIESNDIFHINGEKHFPLQSVFKFHIALAVLNEVDKGTFSLNQEIPILKSDLLQNTWSPLRDAHPKGNIKLPLSDMLKYMVSDSDNNACDILLRLIGGTQVVHDYIHQNFGVKDVAIRVNEEEMHQEWNVQFKNWITPDASNKILKVFVENKLLSKLSYEFLLKIMLETTTGKNRIKSGLPTGTPIAHKTGTSDTNDKGVTAAVHDIGIVFLPNGKYYILSVFVSNSKENIETNEKIISDISTLIWNYYTGEEQ